MKAVIKKAVKSLKEPELNINIEGDLVEITGKHDWSMTSESLELSFCCGVIEMGHFVENPSHYIPEDLKIKALQRFFKQRVDELKEGKRRKVIILNITPKEGARYRLIELALQDEQIFKCVANFNNLNSENVVKTYVSI